ncbi:MAG: hypothetical protein ACLSAH_19465 [Bilophila wadsworthia]
MTVSRAVSVLEPATVALNGHIWRQAGVRDTQPEQRLFRGRAVFRPPCRSRCDGVRLRQTPVHGELCP